MICYEVLTRKEVFQEVRLNSKIVCQVIAEQGQKPSKDHIDSVDKTLKQENSQELKIFQMIKKLLENCWCFEPKERYTTQKSTDPYLLFDM